MELNENNPICPLLSQTQMGGKIVTACQREGCAWWIENKQKCAIVAIGGSK